MTKNCNLCIKFSPWTVGLFFLHGGECNGLAAPPWRFESPTTMGLLFLHDGVNTTVEEPHHRDMTAQPLWGSSFCMMVVNTTVEQPHHSHLTAPLLFTAIEQPHRGGAIKWLWWGCQISMVGLLNRCIHHHAERTAPQSRD